MISAWWLCLIIPASACLGYAICAVVVFLAESEANNLDGEWKP